MLRTVMMATSGLVALMAAAPAAAATVVTPRGSGTVEFSFTKFTGPAAEVTETDTFNTLRVGTVSTIGADNNYNNNGSFGPTGNYFPTGNTPSELWQERIFTFDSLPSSPLTTVEFQTIPLFNDQALNYITFTPRPFANVAVGTPFTIGTIEFQNGGWFGGSQTQGLSRPSTIDFSLKTKSLDGAPFNQSITGRIVHHVQVAPSGADLTTLAGQQAEADWITVYFGNDITCVNNCSFWVYEDLGNPALMPPGFTNRGTVDVQAVFGSLLFAGLTNPQGGFVTPSALPLGQGSGGGVGVIPEPSTWMLMILGFGLIAQQLRRRHLAAA